MRTWRRYTYTPIGGLVRDQHELIINDGQDRDGAPLGCQADGHPIGRAAAAWILHRWLTGRRRGGALWVTRYGPGEAGR